MRLLLLTELNVDDPMANSGMAYRSTRALAARYPAMEVISVNPRGGEVQHVSPPRHHSTLRAIAGPLGPSLRKARRTISRTVAALPWRSQRIFRDTLAQARELGEAGRAAVARVRPDVVICPFGGRSLFGWSPAHACRIVYASDATAALLNSTSYFRDLSPGFRRAAMAVERHLASLVSRAAFCSQATLDSALRDIGYEPERCCVVPMGANVEPLSDSPRDIRPPAPGKVRLLTVAADPVRKRVGLCVQVVKLLRQQGLDATLEVIGPPSSETLNQPGVTVHGLLRLSVPADVDRLRSQYAACDIFLLFSEAEMFGIAPAEAALFGKPSVVSDAGGLPTVVRHGHTGMVVPISASPAEYAAAVRSLIDHPSRYVQLATAARQDALTRLTWDSWALGISRQVDLALEHHNA